MPSPNNINILISVRNKASAPIREARKDIRDFRDELVKFNRRLFTASAVYATFSQGFRRAFNLAGVGAEFDYLRTQFNNTFGSSYLKTFREAARNTIDATSLMQIALQNHARGMKKYETQKIFSLSVGAAKLMGTSTADAAKKMSKAFNDLSVTGLQNFFVALNANNQFKNMNLIIRRLTHGFNAAKMSAENFRKIGMEHLTKALEQFIGGTEDTLTLFMMTKAGFEDLRKVSGAFISRAINPLLKSVSMLSFKAFDRLNSALDDSESKFGRLRLGLVDFLQVGGGVLAGSTALVGGLSLLALVSSTLGVTFGALTGLITLFTIGLKTAKGEGRSWLEFIADVGTELKFYYQAFSSYSDGVSTFSKDVTDRLSQMPEATQNRIMFIAKAFVLARVALDGFTQGVAETVDRITAVLSKFGLWDEKTKQFTQRTENLVKTLGKVAGALAVMWGIKSGIGALKNILGGVPIVGRLFGGGKGGKGPSGTQGDPIYTKDASILGGVGKVGGILASGGIISKILTTLGNTTLGYKLFGWGVNVVAFVTPLLTMVGGWLMVALNGVIIPAIIGAAIGTLADYAFNIFGKGNFSDYLANSWFEALHPKEAAEAKGKTFTPDAMMGGGQLRNELSALTPVDEEARNRQKEMYTQVSALKASGGEIDENFVREITRGGNLTGAETNKLLEKIAKILAQKRSASNKMNAQDTE